MTQKAIYILPVPKIMSFKVLKYFPSGKISYLLAYVNKISSWKNSCFFSEIFVNTTVCFFYKTNVGLWLELALFGN